MKTRPPFLFINFKAYAKATGKNALSLAKKAESIARERRASIFLVVQAVDIEAVSSSVKLPVFAQHIDPIRSGSHTGHVLPEAVKQAGAVGTVLNHAEKRLGNRVLLKSIARAKALNLKVLVCAENVARARQIAAFPKKPDFISLEVPELIGGRISICNARPGFITKGVRAVKETAPKIAVVTGAGIRNSRDVKKAFELGTQGVFVASAIIRAKDQKAAIKELVAGFKE